jgi:hypothetical protein
VKSIDGELRFAIANRRLVELRYKRANRVVEPHDYGVQNGTERLFAYQLRGPASGSGHSPVGWRLFDLPRIESFVVLEQQFNGSRGAAYDSHLTWDVVYARVK